MGMLDGLTNMFKMHDDDDFDTAISNLILTSMKMTMMILMTITKITMMISVMTTMMRNHQQERIFLEEIPRKIQ